MCFPVSPSQNLMLPSAGRHTLRSHWHRKQRATPTSLQNLQAPRDSSSAERPAGLPALLRTFVASDELPAHGLVGQGTHSGRVRASNAETPLHSRVQRRGSEVATHLQGGRDLRYDWLARLLPVSGPYLRWEKVITVTVCSHYGS